MSCGRSRNLPEVLPGSCRRRSCWDSGWGEASRNWTRRHWPRAGHGQEGGPVGSSAVRSAPIRDMSSVRASPAQVPQSPTPRRPRLAFPEFFSPALPDLAGPLALCFGQLGSSSAPSGLGRDPRTAPPRGPLRGGSGATRPQTESVGQVVGDSPAVRLACTPLGRVTLGWAPLSSAFLLWFEVVSTFS
jgi:hypothetical protein